MIWESQMILSAGVPGLHQAPRFLPSPPSDGGEEARFYWFSLPLGPLPTRSSQGEECSVNEAMLMGNSLLTKH